MKSNKTNMIEAISDKLPNGFHDSALYQLRVDYVKKEVEFYLGVDVSDSNAKGGEILHRPCRLVFSGLLFFVVEAPASFESIEGRNGLWLVDIDVLEGDKLKKIYPRKIPEDVFANWFFLNETNSFIYLAAQNVIFEWLE